MFVKKSSGWGCLAGNVCSAGTYPYGTYSSGVRYVLTASGRTFGCRTKGCWASGGGDCGLPLSTGLLSSVGVGGCGVKALRGCLFFAPLGLPFFLGVFFQVSVTSHLEHEVKRKERFNRLMSHTFGWSSSGAFGLFLAPIGLPLGPPVNPLPRSLGSLDVVSI